MKIILKRKKKHISECEAGAIFIGMGPVVPGGPDRFDNIIGGMNVQAYPKRKKLKIKKKIHGK